MALTQIDEYEVMHSANQFRPRIGLKAGGRFIGQLVFMQDGTALPADGKTDGSVTLYYHLASFGHVLDLLRNEQPMYLLYAGSGPGFENGIKSTPEPVGEGEGP